MGARERLRGDGGALQILMAQFVVPVGFGREFLGQHGLCRQECQRRALQKGRENGKAIARHWLSPMARMGLGGLRRRSSVPRSDCSILSIQ